MPKELEWFTVGSSYGGNQDWMRDPWMKLGGCAALTAVDTCIYLTLRKKLKSLCPIDVYKLTKESYIGFAGLMKPFIPPRFHGVNKLSMYTEGFDSYLRSSGSTDISMSTLSMGSSVKDAEAAISLQIDNGIPVPMLHLSPKCKEAEEYEWHWFMLCGIRSAENGAEVKAVTYGEAKWISLDALWNEHDTDNGGLILYTLCQQ